MRLAAATLAASLLLVAPAGAQSPGSTAADPNALIRPAQLNKPPRGHVRTALEVLRTADRNPKARRTLAEHRGATREAFLKGTSRWQVSYYARPKSSTKQGKEIAQVLIDDASGRVVEAWDGYAVAWGMARGYPGAFGRKSNSLYVWIPLCVLFFVPFVDWRRPRRLHHLDLLALLSLSVSLAYFNHGRLGLSVPLAYPPLVYLLGRMLYIGLRRGRGDPERPRRPLPLLVPTTYLAVGLVFLLGFRIGLNVTNSNVVDVGYAGVIGADRVADGSTLYGHFPKDNAHGDTYGPVNYYAYVPFEQTWPWSGRWDDLPAAHGAAVFFDLLCVLLVGLLGWRIRGPTLGVALAYGWAAFPFTLFVSSSNSNDSLPAALALAAVLAAVWRPRPRAGSAVASGALTALAGLTKFAQLALAPLLLTHRRSWRYAAGFALGFAALFAVAVLPISGVGLHAIYDRTLAYQGTRDSPFSIWGYYGLGTAQTVVQFLAGALAIGVAVLPRRDDAVGLAALAGAILIALQLTVSHWFYLYIVWFFPLVLVAVLGDFAAVERRVLSARPERAPGRVRWRRPAPALTR